MRSPRSRASRSSGCSPNATGVQAEPARLRLRGGRLLLSGQGPDALRAEMRSYLDRGYTVVKMKIGGASLDEDLRRIEAVLGEIGTTAKLAVDANGRFDLETAIAYAKALRDYPLFWYEEAGDPLDFRSAGDARASSIRDRWPRARTSSRHQDARNLLRYGGMRPDRDWLQFDCALSYGLCEYLRTLEVLKEHGWSPRALHPARRPPDVAQHRGRPGPRRQRELSGSFPAFRRISRRRRASRTATHDARACRASASKASPTCMRK